MGDRGRKLNKIKQKKDLGLFYLLGDSGSGLNKLTMFFYWSYCKPRY